MTVRLSGGTDADGEAVVCGYSKSADIAPLGKG